jgi:hypothetical protein
VMLAAVFLRDVLGWSPSPGNHPEPHLGGSQHRTGGRIRGLLAQDTAR